MIAGCNGACRDKHVGVHYKCNVSLAGETTDLNTPKKQPPLLKAEVAYLVFKSLIKDRLLYKVMLRLRYIKILVSKETGSPLHMQLLQPKYMFTE